MSNFSNTNFQGKKVLVRVDFNVPLDSENKIIDDTRITAALPTIIKIIKDGGKVILMSHLGRPKDGPTDKFSLKHLVEHIAQLLKTEMQQSVKVFFANDCVGEQAFMTVNMMRNGEVLLLENLRFYAEEEKRDVEFSKKLASLGDIYVNDAFGTAHRAHASTAIIADNFTKENKMFGLLMQAETESAKKVIKETVKPFTAIIGGAKVSDKILIIENLMNTANDIIIGGGMAYTFMKAMGGQVGKSLCEDDKLDIAHQLIQKAKQKEVKLHLPSDSIVADEFNANANIKTENSNLISSNWMGLDIGPIAIEDFSKIILNSKTILWNGPMGVFEMEKFQKGTKAIATAIATATKNGAYSLIGGGDSVSAINEFGFTNQVSYISTGGGALLELFEGKELPGIAAIEKG